jgi:hypothetical protein
MINIPLLYQQFREAGLPVYNVAANGDVSFAYVLTPGEKDLARQILAAHDPTAVLHELAQWSTWTPQQAGDYVQGNILNGMDQAGVDAWIDANVTSLATARTGMKMLAGAILNTRAILKIIATAIVYFRMIVLAKD